MAFGSDTPKIDSATGSLFTAQLVAVDDTGGEVINVNTPGDHKVSARSRVSIQNLVASPWAHGQRSRISYRAESVMSSSRGDKN